MLIKEIDNNDNLRYDIFIDKGINLIDKVYILINQYNVIEKNTEKLINEIKKKVEIIDIKKEDKEKINIDFKYNHTKTNKDMMKDIMNKLNSLDIYLNNYIKNFKNNIYYIFVQIKEFYKNHEYYNKEFFIYYKNEIIEFDKLFSIYKEIKIDDKKDELFEHINNISNNYILVRKNILSINIIIKLGELLKIENKKIRIIYEKLQIQFSVLYKNNNKELIIIDIFNYFSSISIIIKLSKIIIKTFCT